jgi:hypothetical protein
VLIGAWHQEMLGIWLEIVVEAQIQLPNTSASQATATTRLPNLCSLSRSETLPGLRFSELVVSLPETSQYSQADRSHVLLYRFMLSWPTRTPSYFL